MENAITSCLSYEIPPGAITSCLSYEIPPGLPLTDTNSVETTDGWAEKIIKAKAHRSLEITRWHTGWDSPNITPEFADSGQIFEAILPLYLKNSLRDLKIADRLNITPEFADSGQIFEAILSLYLKNSLRDLKIADRLITLHRDALAEDELILSASLRQFTEFFLMHPDLGFPRITLTPDNTLRVRWIQGEGNFVALEFIGSLVVKLVAEIPREGGLTAQYFSVESFDKILSSALAIGASFT